MARVEVFGGVCGFNTVIRAAAAGRRQVELTLETDCPNWQKAAAALKTVNAFKELFVKLHESEVYRAAAPFIPHPACPVPAGMMKAIEVAAGLALPRDAWIKVSGEE